MAAWQMPEPEPLRGDIWLVDRNPVRGHEQAGVRPPLILSVDALNAGPAGLMTTAASDEPIGRTCATGWPRAVMTTPWPSRTAAR